MKEQSSYPLEGFTPFERLSGIAPTAPMLIALSGGADSRVLFHLAALHCRRHGSQFYACHVNHGIRGDEAIRDRDFCVALAKDCPECADIFVLNADVPALAAASGNSLELEARRVRYSFFESIMTENNIPILVTAHNADDNLETLIFNLTRGSGAKGMCGIPESRPTPGGILIRPMLGIPKSEILEYCRANSLQYVTDSTNSSQEYTRNLIRARIIPCLEEINPSVRQAAARLSESMKELCGYTFGQAEEYLPADGCPSVSLLSKAPAPLLTAALSTVAERNGIDLCAVHLSALANLITEAKDGTSLSLPDKKRAVIYGDSLCFEHDDRVAVEPTPFDVPLSEGSLSPSSCCQMQVSLTDRGCDISLSLTLNREKSINSKNVYKLDIRAHIISDKINKLSLSENRLRLRTRRPGDRIASGGINKSIKKLMCDRSLPRAARDRIPLLCLGDEVLWVPGVATADQTKCRYFEK